jgi:hypothetical protein
MALGGPRYWTVIPTRDDVITTGGLQRAGWMSGSVYLRLGATDAHQFHGTDPGGFCDARLGYIKVSKPFDTASL